MKTKPKRYASKYSQPQNPSGYFKKVWSHPSWGPGYEMHYLVPKVHPSGKSAVWAIADGQPHKFKTDEELFNGLGHRDWTSSRLDDTVMRSLTQDELYETGIHKIPGSEGFRQALQKAPNDNTTRAAYADWLREQGHDQHADYQQTLASPDTAWFDLPALGYREETPEVQPDFKNKPRRTNPDHLSRKSHALPRRFAKVDGDVVAHNLVHGFPIEHALRHLANDPANPGDIRDLAYVALTGRNKLTGEVKQEGHPEALWALHDALRDHDHPAKDWYHWMNAADKLQHDQHTYTALLEEAERMRKDHGRSHTARRDWAYRPEGQAVRVGQEFGEDNKDAFDVKVSRQQALGRIHARVKQLAGSHLDEKAINESIMRHVVRANHVWRREHGVDTGNDVRRATQAFEEVKDRPGHNLHHKAARYDRKVKPKKYMFIDKTYVKGKPHEGWHVSWLSPGGKFFPVPAHSSHAEQSRAMGFESPDALFQDGWHRVIVQGRDVYVYNPHTTLNHKQKGELTDAAMTEGMTAVNHDNGKTTRVIWDKQDRFQRRYALAVRGDFIDALRKIQSSNHKSLRQVAEQVSRKVGLGMVKVLPGLHDTSRGSVPGVVQAIYGHATPEQVHQVASWIGLTGNLPGMAVFHARPEGVDLLHKFRQQGSGIELRDKLDRAGIRDRVIAIPSGNPTQVGYDVLVPDKGGRMAPMIQDYTKRQGVPLQTSRGYFKTVGSQNQAKARDKYRTQVSSTEKKAYSRTGMTPENAHKKSEEALSSIRGVFGGRAESYAKSAVKASSKGNHKLAQNFHSRFVNLVQDAMENPNGKPKGELLNKWYRTIKLHSEAAFAHSQLGNALAKRYDDASH